MDGPEFFFTLLLGIFVGTMITLMIQAYGRRKVKRALGSDIAPHTLEPKQAERTVALLASENGRQQNQILRLEERLQVLERIATDSPARLADSIEALR